MSYMLFLIGIILFVLYYSLKFSAYRAFFLKRPTLKAVFDYSFVNNEKRGRNARAFKYLAIFMFVVGLFVLPASSNWEAVLNDRPLVLLLLKMLILLVIGINFMARNVLYEEVHKGNRKFAIPLLELVDVFRKTSWFECGRDYISMIVNLTTIALVVVLIGLLYMIFIVN